MSAPLSASDLRELFNRSPVDLPEDFSASEKSLDYQRKINDRVKGMTVLNLSVAELLATPPSPPQGLSSHECSLWSLGKSGNRVIKIGMGLRLRPCSLD